MVNDLSDTHHHKPTLALQSCKSLDDFSENPTKSINNHTGITPSPPFYTKRPNELHMAQFKFFSTRRPFLQSKINHKKCPLPSSPEQHPTLPNYSNTNTTQNDNLATPTDKSDNNTLVSPDSDGPIKIYSKTNYFFHHHRFKLQSLYLYFFCRTLHY